MAATRARLEPLHTALAGLWLVAYVVLALWGIGAHWLEGHDGWTGAQLGISAVNTIRFGPRATKFSRTDYYTGPTAPTDPEAYWPTYSAAEGLLLAAVFRMFGPEPWAARLLYLAISVVTFVLLVRLAAREFGPGTAVLTAFVLALMPTFAFYGRMATYDVPVMCLGILIITVYLAWLDVPEDRRLFIALHVLVAIAVFWGYTIHFLVPCLLLHYAAFRPPVRARFRLFPTLPVVWLAAACLFVMQVALIRGPRFFLERLRIRTGVGAGYVPALEFLHKQVNYSRDHFTPLLCALVVAWGVVLVARGIRATARRSPARFEVAFRGTLGRSDATVVLLLLYPAGYLLFFKELTDVHDYVLVGLVPFVALASARTLSMITRKLPAAVAVLLLVAFGIAYVRQSTDRLASAYHHGHYRGLEQIEVARYVGAKTRAGDKVALGFELVEHTPQFKFYLRNGFDFAEAVPMPRREAHVLDRTAFRRAIANRAVHFVILDKKTVDATVLRKVVSRFAVEDVYDRLVVDVRTRGPRYTRVRPIAVSQSAVRRYLTYTPLRYHATDDPTPLLRLASSVGLDVTALPAPLSSRSPPRNLLATPSARPGFTSWTRIEVGGDGRWDRTGADWRCLGFDGGAGHTGWKSDPVRVRPGAPYRLRGDVSTAGQKTGLAALRVDWYAADGKLIQEAPALVTAAGVTTWNRVTSVTQAPPRAALAEVKFFVDGQPPVTVDTRFRKLAFAPAAGWGRRDGGAERAAATAARRPSAPRSPRRRAAPRGTAS